MKVTDIKVTALSIPLARPFDGVPPLRSFNPILVQLKTEDGLEGVGIALTFNGESFRDSLSNAIKYLTFTVLRFVQKLDYIISFAFLPQQKSIVERYLS